MNHSLNRCTDLVFSVVIPCFNEESYVCSLLSDLESQTIELDKFEVVVVDNNSTDRTSQVVWDYAINSKLNIRILHEYTPGVSLARNRGSNIARGDVIVFLDADNALKESFLLRLYDYTVNRKYLAGSIRTLPDELDVKGWLVFTVLEIIKIFSFKPFGKSFVTKDVLYRSDGFNEDIVLGENVEFLQKIKRIVKQQGGKFGHFRPGITCSLRRFKQVGYMKVLVPWLIAYLGVYSLKYKTMADFDEKT